MPRFAAFLLLIAALSAPAADFRSYWPAKLVRPWAGPEYWANPLQDWRVANGRLENIVPGGDRNVFLLTREVTAGPGAFTMSVRLGRMDLSGPLAHGFAGFRVGIHGDFADYRDSAVRGVGMNAGIAGDARLFIGSLEPASPKVNGPLRDIELRLDARPEGAAYTLTLQAFDRNGAKLAETSRAGVPSRWLEGGLALVSSSAAAGAMSARRGGPGNAGWQEKIDTARGGRTRFWFRDWRVSGAKVAARDGRAFGPILFTLYTLNRKVLKLSAQMAPVDGGAKEVRLEARDGGAWRVLGKAPIDPMSRNAAFRIPGWDDTRDTPYRVVYTMGGRNWQFAGTIRRDPVDKPRIVVAAFTGNNDLGFPHADIVRHVRHFQPDFLAYTGDNIYERVGEYGIEREPVETATLDYLRKWYLFGWEYRDLLREIPSVCLPDDHDVYHGNLWGAGGRRATAYGQPGQDQGGYTMPAAWVNMVQRTQTSHMADPHDPTPVEQGIGVYYGSMLWGGLSIAVIEDRKWKSAPAVAAPKGKIVNGWPQNPEYDAARDGDVPGAELLGRRQEEFLEKWARDWSGGAWMKAVVSQTIFSTVATLPKDTTTDAIVPKLRVSKPGEYVEGDAPTEDHDSNGWPQTPRNRALRAMRKGLAFHIAGDQHLASTIQYGIDDWNDASWAICVPSVANIFPRRWFPTAPGRNRKPGAPRYTGEFLDGFGNRMTVHAVANPVAGGVEPAALHDRAPGYGIVVFDRATRGITIANWPRWVDPSKPGAKPYEGWPITIGQFDNGYPRGGLSLGIVEAEIDDPVVEVTEKTSGELIYAVRIQGRRFEPKVFRPGVYGVRAVDPERGYERSYGERTAARQ